MVVKEEGIKTMDKSPLPVDPYPSPFAFIYVFNLIVGAGALAMPLAFSNAGLVLGTAIVAVLCFVSYITVTYVIEAMAAANAWSLSNDWKAKKNKNVQERHQIADHTLTVCQPDEGSENFSERFPLILDQEIPSKGFEIVKKFEMAQMAEMFFNKGVTINCRSTWLALLLIRLMLYIICYVLVGLVLYYLCICIYLYGDLAIYAVAIPKSMRTVICPHFKGRRIQWEENVTDGCYNISHAYDNKTNRSQTECVVGNNHCMGPLSPDSTYYIFLGVFSLLLCPWTFFNVQKTKLLQLITTITRNLAFGMMIVIALIEIVQGNKTKPKPFDFKELPDLFGVCIYSFMCQHSLPGMITPMKSKKYVFPMLAADYGLIFIFYSVMCYTAVFRFGGVLQDIYTLNFLDNSRVWRPLAYYLALFPVFTLSTNFPIISVTLLENLKVLFKIFTRGKDYPFIVDRIFFPLVAVVPPIAIAFATTDVEALVSWTGSLPGVGVQYVIPVALVYCARRKFHKQFRSYNNKHKSWIGGIVMFVIVLVWALASTIMIIVDRVLKAVDD